jgi:hypothetical protein
MSSPIRPSVNITLMLRDNLPQSLRELDTQIKMTESRLEELRRDRTTLAQIAIAAGIDTAPVIEQVPEKTPESTEPRQVAA